MRGCGRWGKSTGAESRAQWSDSEARSSSADYVRGRPKAIHIYGGDFFVQPRSEWDPATLEERPYRVENAMRAFAEANERWEAGRAVKR